MTLSVFKAYNNIGEGLVAQSALKAGGFHPVFQNEHYAYMASLEMLALGGLIILLPSDEIDAAQDYLAGIQAAPIEDYDEIAARPRGNWIKASLMGTAFGMFLPAFVFVPAVWLMLAGLVLLFVPHPAALASGVTLCIVAPMLLHAQYVAVPRMKDKQASPA